MSEEDQKQFDALAERLRQTEAELAMWRNAQIAPESGGGNVSFGKDQVIIRINSLTNTSAQMP